MQQDPPEQIGKKRFGTEQDARTRSIRIFLGPRLQQVGQSRRDQDAVRNAQLCRSRHQGRPRFPEKRVRHCHESRCAHLDRVDRKRIGCLGRSFCRNDLRREKESTDQRQDISDPEGKRTGGKRKAADTCKT